MREPTPKQRKYFSSLVDRVVEKEGINREEVYDSLGLIEANAFGGRMRNEIVTSANMSRWIGLLKGRAES